MVEVVECGPKISNLSRLKIFKMLYGASQRKTFCCTRCCEPESNYVNDNKYKTIRNSTWLSMSCVCVFCLSFSHAAFIAVLAIPLSIDYSLLPNKKARLGLLLTIAFYAGHEAVISARWHCFRSVRSYLYAICMHRRELLRWGKGHLPNKKIIVFFLNFIILKTN